MVSLSVEAVAEEASMEEEAEASEAAASAVEVSVVEELHHAGNFKYEQSLLES